MIIHSLKPADVDVIKKQPRLVLGKQQSQDCIYWFEYFPLVFGLNANQFCEKSSRRTKLNIPALVYYPCLKFPKFNKAV